MDGKNKNLTPELKAIYERVMNTPVKPGGAAGATANAGAPSAVTSSTPALPSIASAPSEAKPGSSPMASTSSPAGSKPLSSVAPQPVLGDDKPFVFSADGKKQPVKPMGAAQIDKSKTAPVGKPGGRSKISTPMMVGGGVTFLALYIVVWMKFFGFF